MAIADCREVRFLRPYVRSYSCRVCRQCVTFAAWTSRTSARDATPLHFFFIPHVCPFAANRRPLLHARVLACPTTIIRSPPGVHRLELLRGVS